RAIAVCNIATYCRAGADRHPVASITICCVCGYNTVVAGSDSAVGARTHIAVHTVIVHPTVVADRDGGSSSVRYAHSFNPRSVSGQPHAHGESTADSTVHHCDIALSSSGNAKPGTAAADNRKAVEVERYVISVYQYRNCIGTRHKIAG